MRIYSIKFYSGGARGTLVRVRYTYIRRIKACVADFLQIFFWLVCTLAHWCVTTSMLTHCIDHDSGIWCPITCWVRLLFVAYGFPCQVTIFWQFSDDDLFVCLSFVCFVTTNVQCSLFGPEGPKRSGGQRDPQSHEKVQQQRQAQARKSPDHCQQSSTGKLSTYAPACATRVRGITPFTNGAESKHREQQ